MGFYITDYTGDPNNAGGAPTNLSVGTRTSTELPINNSNGNGVSLPVANSTEAGLMASADKAKLDGISGSAGVKTITSIKEDLVTEPVTTGLVYCKQYWPGTTAVGKGGLFAWDATSTATIDNGTVFAGVPTTGRWIRYKGGADPTIDDFGAVGVATPYNRDLSLAASGAPQTLLSSKFATLALAQAWYPAGDLLSTAESLNSAAIQQAHAFSRVLKIPVGTYWINRTIEIYTKRSFTGAGSALTSIICPASCGAAFKPLARQAPQSSESEIYKKNMKLGGFSCWSDANTVNYSTGDSIVTATYDQTKSGFYSPPRKRDGADGLVGNLTAEEANLGFPLWIDSDLSDMIFGRFAGDGFFLGLQFSSKISFVTGDENAGYAINWYANSGSSLSNCYALRLNLKGGFNLPFGGVLINCNGVDSFAKKRRWGTVGIEGSNNAAVVSFTNCNFEGVDQALFIYGDATSVTFNSCTFQWWIAAGESDQTPLIRCYGAGGSVRFINRNYFSPALGNSPVAPANLMRVKGNAWTVLADEPIKVGGTDLTWLVVDADNNPGSFGYGSAKFPTETVNYPGNGVGAARYGEYVKQAPPTSVPRLYVGRSQSGAEPMISFSAGSGAPGNGFQKGSIYARIDGANANEVLYICTAYNSSTGVSTWVAK